MRGLAASGCWMVGCGFDCIGCVLCIGFVLRVGIGLGFGAGVGVDVGWVDDWI